MKPKSKKDQYTVKCENKSQTADVLNYIHNDNDREWSYWKYVHKFIDLNGVDDNDINNSIPDNLKYLPVISFEEWSNLPEYDPKELAFKNFVLPEKWCVNGSEELGEYFNEINVINLSGTYIDQYYYITYDGKWDCGVSLNGMSLITFEQFKEHVLGEKNINKLNGILTNVSNKVKEKLNENKKIVGYKLVKEEYKEAVKAIIGNNDWFHNFDKNLHKYGYNFGSGEETSAIIFSVEQTIKNAGVLDLWFKPVYEEPTIEERISDYLAGEGIGLTDEQVKNVIDIVNESKATQM